MGNIFFGSMMDRNFDQFSEQFLQSSHIEAKTKILKTELSELHDQVERLSLLNQALWELLRDRLGLSDGDLEQKAQEVDLRDGVLDGKKTRHPLRCPHCGRISSSRHKKCLYCNLEFQSDIFD